MIKNSKLLFSINKLFILLFIIIFPWIGSAPFIGVFLSFLFLFTGLISLTLEGEKISHFKWALLLLAAVLSFLSYSIVQYGVVYIYSSVIAGIILYGNNTKIAISFFSYRKATIFKIVGILSIILISFTWHYTHDNRLSIANGGPNSSAIILFSLIVSTSFFIDNNNSKKVFTLLTLLIVLFLTDSRMLALMIVCYYFLTILLKYKRFVNFSGVMIFIISIIAQYVIWILFLDNINIVNSSTNVVERLININDTSNFDRVNSYGHAFDTWVKTIDNILFGVKDYWPNKTPLGVGIPHNWFMGMLIDVGLIYTIFFSFFILYLIFTINHAYKPAFYSLILGAGILNPFVMTIPVMLIFLMSIMKSDSAKCNLKQFKKTNSKIYQTLKNEN